MTVIFSAATAGLALAAALLLAVMADRVIRGAVGYKTLLMAPYAIAPVVAGVLWLFMFNPTVGIIAYILRGLGYTWNHQLNGAQALLLVILACGLEADQLQLPVLPGRPPGDPEGGHRGRRDRRRRPRPALLADRLPAALARRPSSCSW